MHALAMMTHTWSLCCPTPTLTRTTPGRSEKECEGQDSLCVKANVNEEYLEAFRTKSYIEICNKAQGQLGRTIRRSPLLSSNNNSPSTNSSSSTVPFCKHLTEFLLDPRQENIASMAETTKVHHLLVNYFESSLEACHCCDQILQGLHSMRLSYRRIKRVVKISKMVLEDCNNNGDQQQQIQKDVIYRELASFALQNNPLSIQFHDIHQRFMELLHRLRSKRVKIQRKLTWKSICKKVAGIGLVTAHSAIVVALLVLCFHSIVGLVAAPGILGGLVGWLMKRLFKGKNNKNGRIRRSYCERLCEQLDVAARGIYIVINELNTVSRMVMRLHDEVEHRRVIAQVCVKNYGKSEILRQVLRDLNDNQSSFLDQLEELENHIYFCFLTINRSRSLLLQEITQDL